jgi:hypothetical protein
VITVTSIPIRTTTDEPKTISLSSRDLIVDSSKYAGLAAVSSITPSAMNSLLRTTIPEINTTAPGRTSNSQIGENPASVSLLAFTEIEGKKVANEKSRSNIPDKSIENSTMITRAVNKNQYQYSGLVAVPLKFT